MTSSTSVDELVSILKKEKMDENGRINVSITIIESFLKLAYSCGRVDALVDYRNEVSKHA